MLSAVVDTNVFVRGLLGSVLNRKVNAALRDNKFRLLISDELFDELLDVVTRPKFRNVFIPEATARLIELIKTQAEFVMPSQRVTICRDLEGQKILECALERADIIVSNDNDLPILKYFRNIPIVTPIEFLKRLE